LLRCRLVIEVDGATHSTGDELASDAARFAAIEKQGFAVLRFSDNDVFRNLEGVVETILAKLVELRARIEGPRS
jgi:very-short-patch-repair endonuclease